MNQSNWATKCATLGPLGYLPAPGTVGSLVGLCCALIVAPLYYFNYFFTALLFFSWIIIFYALKQTERTDPQQIILDEFIGMLVPFFFISGTLSSVISSFVLFRFFDITKWCGVSFFEKCPGPCGILLDDCAAGLLAGGFVWCATYLSI